MEENKSFLMELDYGDRMNFRPFLIDLMESFDSKCLTGISFFVNNNPYNLEFLLFLNFEKEDDKFQDWIRGNYPEKEFSFQFNYPLEEIIENLTNCRYNFYSFSTKDQMDEILTDGTNEIFRIPSRKILNKTLGGSADHHKKNDFRVFLSHSSLDKPLVSEIFVELQKSEITTWFDKYEIEFGDNITEKINKGLENSRLGLLCISKNFLQSNWAKSEMSFFLQEQINSGIANFICLNMDLEHSQLPALIRNYKYLNMREENWKERLVDIVRDRAGRNSI